MADSRQFFAQMVSLRHGIAISAAVLAAYLIFYQSAIQPVKLDELREYEVTPAYVGELTVTHTRSGLMAHSTEFDGGYGVGIPNEWARDDLTRRVKPVVYVPFAQELEVTPQLAQSVKPGLPYKVKIFRGELFEVADATRTILPYADYARNVGRKKDLFIYAAIAIIALAATFWLIGQFAVRAARET